MQANERQKALKSAPVNCCKNLTGHHWLKLAALQLTNFILQVGTPLMIS